MATPKDRYKITGLGITRALQKATDEQKDLVVVWDDDRNGRPVNIGYFLVPKGEPVPTKPNIIRLNPNEIEFSLENTPGGDFTQAVLGAEFIHPRDNERHFLFNLPIDPNCRFVLRNLFRLTNNSVTGFVIQVEILRMKGNKSESRPVIRYDQAHGFIHRDMIGIDGSKKKHKIKTQDTKKAIILAIDEIRDNLNSWLKQLGYSPYGQQILRLPFIVQEMDKAKAKLLELHDNPESIKNLKSSYFHLQEGPNLTVNL